MRERKYRAWDKYQKTMHYFGNLEVCKNALCFHNSPSDSSAENNWGALEDPEPDIMDYTGLKDKDGIEAWEGDIRMFGTGIGIIVWDIGQWAIKSPGSGAIDYSDVPLAIMQSKLLGSIHTHPELLEGE